MYGNYMEFTYQKFLANQTQNQLEMEAFINEMVLRASGEYTVENAVIIHETFANKVKENWQKLIDMFKKMWGKFSESVSRLINNNKTYLEKYKDIILTKKPKDESAEISMHKYDVGVRNISGSPVPEFNYDKYKEILSSNDAFIAGSEIKDYKIGNGQGDMKDTFGEYFIGSTDTSYVKVTTLNMTDLYNYCYSYDTLKDKIEKDVSSIYKAHDAAVKLIESAASAGTIKNNDTEEESSKNESYIYENNLSFIYENSDEDSVVKKLIASIIKKKEEIAAEVRKKKEEKDTNKQKRHEEIIKKKEEQLNREEEALKKRREELEQEKKGSSGGSEKENSEEKKDGEKNIGGGVKIKSENNEKIEKLKPELKTANDELTAANEVLKKNPDSEEAKKKVSAAQSKVDDLQGQMNKLTGTSSTSAAKSYKGVDGENKNIDKEKLSKDDSAAKLKAQVGVYYDVCMAIVQTKFNAADEIFKAYMAIIKKHVRDHVGESADDNKKAAQAGSTY